jgi:hypothetical protein
MTAAHALLVRLDVAHLPAVRAFALSGLRLSRRGRHGGFAVGSGSGGVGRGGRGGGGEDALGFLALVAAFAVFLKPSEFLGESARNGG